MLDINKLRNAYNVIHRMSQNRHPFAEEELSLEVVQSAQVQEALADAAEVIAVYGKIMNLVSQSTSFKVAPKTPKAVKSSFVVEQDDLSRLQPMTEATNITKLVKYINDTFADKEMHNLKKSVIFGGVVGAPALFVPLFATSFLVVCYDNICA